MHKRDIDAAFADGSLLGTAHEPTYSGALSFLRRRYTKDLTGVEVAVGGVPFDLATTHRPGARFGPAAVRAASANLAWGPIWPWGFDPTERLAVVDCGDCLIDHGDPATVPDRILEWASAIVEAGVHLVVVGGDHFVSLPLLRAQVRRHGPLALVHFDAHSDTWTEASSRIDHGTMFYRAVQEGLVDPGASVQIGIRTHNSDPLGFTWLDAAWVHEHGPHAAVERTLEIVGERRAYLTFDIDCLDPAFAPGTGTPVAGGLSSHQALAIVRGLGSIDFVGMDLVEVAPAYDHAEITALAGATVIVEYLCTRAAGLPSRVPPR